MGDNLDPVSDSGHSGSSSSSDSESLGSTFTSELSRSSCSSETSELSSSLDSSEGSDDDYDDPYDDDVEEFWGDWTIALLDWNWVDRAVDALRLGNDWDFFIQVFFVLRGMRFS
jgi:hypothetical protein